jgi:hypothetical protein
MLLPAALMATLLVLPLLRATRINWRGWWQAMAFLVGGLVLLAGPYIAAKGSLGTKPGIARVLGLEARSAPLGLERERPLPEGQTTLDTYGIAILRMAKVFRMSVTPPLFTFAILGSVLAATLKDRIRTWLFLLIVLGVSACVLVRLHATGGYCTVRHGLVPGMLLTITAAHAITWALGKIAIPGRWFGLASVTLRPGPAVWAALVFFVVVLPYVRSLGPMNYSPFRVYCEAGRWLAQNASGDDCVLDLTDWSLFFSKRQGYLFASVYDAPRNPNTRWIVARKPHVQGHWHYSEVIRAMIGARDPVALIPEHANGHQVQVCIYDLQSPVRQSASSPTPAPAETRLR